MKSDAIPTLAKMSKDERSLLLFLETCATDHGGIVDVCHMNAEDFQIVEQWTKQGFVRFGRICAADVMRLCNQSTRRLTYWVELSEWAWPIAHAERRARCQRLMAKRSWRKTEELLKTE